MNLNQYEFSTVDNFQDFTFFSEGPKGKIKKVIKFFQIQDDPVVYNLAFGDETIYGTLNDSVISDNKDTLKILATVANTIHVFCDYNGNHLIFAQGSTPSRTRLYQMGISQAWAEIQKDFTVWGFKGNEWHPFTLKVNYEAFLVKRN